MYVGIERIVLAGRCFAAIPRFVRPEQVFDAATEPHHGNRRDAIVSRTPDSKRSPSAIIRTNAAFMAR
jgi:hypothetical protein